MALVTGDRYLDSLVKFVENHADRLIDGSLMLKLNPVGLRYVQSRLEALAELETLLTGAPVDYLRAYVSDLGDHRALEQLRRILRLLPSLKVVSVLPAGRRDPTPIYLVPFTRLKVLELRGCDLSTSAAKGLLELRFTLEKFICHNSTDALRHVFASRIADIRDSHQWNRLSFVSCARNSLVLMDESLQLLPVVETLDLSRNKFTTVDNLRKCMKLKHVDFGFNNLRSIASFAEVSCQIVKLVLRNNALTSLHGIEKLKSLQGLDLSYNIISNFSEIEILAGFSALQNLWLDGNPICCSRWFRPQVFSLFSYPKQLKLDDMKISRSEFWKRQVIIASRQKQPSSFGFYFPVQDDADGEGNTNTRRKRTRLVNIEDDEGSTHAYTDHDSPSCDNHSQTKDENTDQEVEIEDLVRRIESLKKDHSVLWLQEFQEWMNQASVDSVGGNKFRNNILHENIDVNKERDEDFADTSTHIFDSFQLSGDDSSTVILESETSFADTSTSAQRYLDQIGESASRSFIGLDVGDRNLSKNLKLNNELSFLSNEGNALVDDGDFNSFVVLKRDDATTENAISTLTALHDITGSQSSLACPGSPPHYQEDILHRRHNLEEEFLQLSAESFSLASSESNTSCSEDDSAEVGHVVTQFDQSSVGNSSEKSRNRIFSDSFCDDAGEAYYDKILLAKPNGTNTSSHGRELDFSAFVCGGSFLNDLHGHEKLGYIKGKTKSFEMPRHRRKHRRRMISLPEEEDTHSDIDHVDTSRGDIVHGLESCCSRELQGSPLARNNEDRATPTTVAHRNDDVIETYFNSNVPHSEVDEMCRKSVRCSCLFEEESGYNEREVAVILSNKEKLYITLVGASDGSGPGLNVVGCHRVNDVMQVFVGLGLQIMRVCFEGNVTYLFITRCMERSRELLCILHIFDSFGMDNMCTLTSLEHMQFNHLVEHVCGGSNICMFQYSMVLFCLKEYGENLWLPRSLFMLDRHLLLCTENVKQFGLTENAVSPDYFSQGSCCAISAVSKMVIKTQDNLCITLFFEHTSEFHPSGKGSSIQDAALKKKGGPYLLTWKLQWFSRDGLLNFVALIRALHCSVRLHHGSCLPEFV